MFLRNFYTALDYESNLILVGVNSNVPERDRAHMTGVALPPDLGGSKSGYVIVIFIVLAMLFGVAILVFMKANKDLNKKTEQNEDDVEEDLEEVDTEEE